MKRRRVRPALVAVMAAVVAAGSFVGEVRASALEHRTAAGPTRTGRTLTESVPGTEIGMDRGARAGGGGPRRGDGGRGGSQAVRARWWHAPLRWAGGVATGVLTIVLGYVALIWLGLVEKRVRAANPHEATEKDAGT